MKMGSNLRKITVETSKLRSSRSMRSLKSCDRLDMSAHFLIFEKNWIRLKETGVKSQEIHDTPAGFTSRHENFPLTNVTILSGRFYCFAEPLVTDLSLEERRILVRETQFPSISPLPTVGVDPFLQAAYSEQASQWTTSPCRHNTPHHSDKNCVIFSTQVQKACKSLITNCYGLQLTDKRNMKGCRPILK